MTRSSSVKCCSLKLRRDLTRLTPGPSQYRDCPKKTVSKEGGLALLSLLSLSLLLVGVLLSYDVRCANSVSIRFCCMMVSLEASLNQLYILHCKKCLCHCHEVLCGLLHAASLVTAVLQQLILPGSKFRIVPAAFFPLKCSLTVCLLTAYMLIMNLTFW